MKVTHLSKTLKVNIYIYIYITLSISIARHYSLFKLTLYVSSCLNSLWNVT
jgi:hypothetical protein